MMLVATSNFNNCGGLRSLKFTGKELEPTASFPPATLKSSRRVCQAKKADNPIED